MARIDLKTDDTVVVVVDVQSTFLQAMVDSARVQDRTQFLVDIAHLLQIPILGTEQNRARMGGLLPSLAEKLTHQAFDKMSFSSCGSEEFMNALAATGRTNIVLVGIETHICMTQTSLDLSRMGFQVAVCPDGASARTNDRHKLGMERMRDGGIVPIHTEAVAYEWMQSADHPKFREALQIVKNAQY